MRNMVAHARSCLLTCTKRDRVSFASSTGWRYAFLNRSFTTVGRPRNVIVYTRCTSGHASTSKQTMSDYNNLMQVIGAAKLVTYSLCSLREKRGASREGSVDVDSSRERSITSTAGCRSGCHNMRTTRSFVSHMLRRFLSGSNRKAASEHFLAALSAPPMAHVAWQKM